MGKPSPASPLGTFALLSCLRREQQQVTEAVGEGCGGGKSYRLS